MYMHDAGDFAVTTGLHRGKVYVYVTHRNTGHQWVSKAEYSNDEVELRMLASNIRTEISRFDPNQLFGSCDTRFFLPVVQSVKPKLNDNFDLLCFSGD